MPIIFRLYIFPIFFSFSLTYCQLLPIGLHCNCRWHRLTKFASHTLLNKIPRIKKKMWICRSHTLFSFSLWFKIVQFKIVGNILSYDLTFSFPFLSISTSRHFLQLFGVQLYFTLNSWTHTHTLTHLMSYSVYMRKRVSELDSKCFGTFT